MKPRQAVRRIVAAAAGSAPLSVRVRSSYLGQLYINHLKKYRIVKLCAPWVWRKFYFLDHLAEIYGKSLKLPLLPLFAIAKQNQTAMLSTAEIVTTPRPSVFPKHCEQHLIQPHTEYKFPEIYIVEVQNAKVTGGTNLVMTDSTVICHDLYDFSRDFTSEELNWRAHIWPYRQRIAWLMPTVPVFEFERAACFTDACAHNYAHWMTEVLPRINLFCSTDKSSEVPLILNDGLHDNLMESLRAIAGNEREIVTLPIGSCVHVKQLAITSVAGYVPFDRRSNWIKNHSHGRFSRFALLALRQCLRGDIDYQFSSTPRKIFIKRNSGIRNLINSIDVEKALIALGFSVVEPEFLTFSQQVRLFSNADIVVGATGAAMANLIFCKPGTKVIVLISDYKFMPYWYWQNMACTVGNQVIYVLGKCVESMANLHSDFKVCVPDVLDAIG